VRREQTNMLSDKEKLKLKDEVSKNLLWLKIMKEEYEKQVTDFLLESSRKYKLSIDFERYEVTDWGDLK
jgi:hypothetical protein